MSAPRTKRQFAGAASDPAQRQITSFFSRQTSYQDGSLPQLQQQPSSRPALPAMVQSNLLSVGMRVRKSVAEGHKNGVGCDFSMWSSDGAPQKPRAAVHHNHNHHHHHTAPQQAPSSVPPPVPATTAPHHHAHQQRPFDPRSSSYVPLPGTSATRELLPFCGIHNVGGGEQPQAHAPSPAARVFAEPRARQSRDPWSSAAPLPPKGGRGQQQGAVAVAASDFPEADFLDYGQYSPDLDMGGV
ncbi:hypothetical protein RB600_006370 [Gaeumannomyces tritici]